MILSKRASKPAGERCRPATSAHPVWKSASCCKPDRLRIRLKQIPPQMRCLCQISHREPALGQCAFQHFPANHRRMPICETSTPVETLPWMGVFFPLERTHEDQHYAGGNSADDSSFGPRGKASLLDLGNIRIGKRLCPFFGYHDEVFTARFGDVPY